MKPRLLLAGGVALAFYAAHVVDLLLLHPASVLLWSCDVAALLVPIALLAGIPSLNAAAGIVLLTGLPLWGIDIATGGEFRLTAPLIHLGSPALALLGMRRLGVPRGSSLLAILVMGSATFTSAFVGPAEENINLSRAVPPGWETMFPNHGLYLTLLGSAMAAVAVVLEFALRRMIRSPA